MNTFKFSIGQTVSVAASGEVGTIHGRAEYDCSQNSYYITLKSADGRAVQVWWNESELALAN